MNKLKKIPIIAGALLIAALNLQLLSYAQTPNFDLGFKDGYTSEVANGDVYDKFEAFRKTLPEKMNVYNPSEPDGKIKIFVATDGNDSNPGTIEQPVKTLERAVKLLENCTDRSGGAVIYIRGGEYSLDKQVKIPSYLSGTPDAPIYISSYQDEEVVISGADIARVKSVAASKDSAVDRVKENVRDKVRVVDLSSSTVSYKITTEGYPTILIDDAEYTPARYPDSGYLKFAMYNGPGAIAGVVNPGDVWQQQVAETSNIPYTGRTSEGMEFKMDTTKPTRWQDIENVWIYGRMSVDWDWGYYQIARINPDIPSLKTVQPSDWGCAYTAYNSYYFLNVLEELNQPGEMYYDSENKKVYFYPIKSYSDDDEIKVVIPKSGITSLLRLEGCTNVIVNGIKFKDCSSRGIEVDGYNDVIQNCTFENITNWSVILRGLYDGVSHCIFRNCGFGVNVAPLNKSTYERNRSEETYTFVQNNYFEHTERYCVMLSGTTNRVVVSFNSFNSNRDQCVYGNSTLDDIMEYNYSVGGAIDVADSGDMYFGASRFASKRSVFRYNLFDGDLPSGVSGFSAVYLDNFSHQNYVYGNYFIDKVLKHSDETTVYNNIFVAKDNYKDKNVNTGGDYYAHDGHANDFVLGMYDNKKMEYYNERDLMLNSKFLYSYDFRGYTGYLDDMMRTKAYGKEYSEEQAKKDLAFRMDKNVSYTKNIYYNFAPFNFWKDEKSTFKNNFETDKDPGFENINGNYTLKDGAVAYKAIDGFEKLPSTDEIGSKLKVELSKPELYYPFNDAVAPVSNTNLIFRWSKCEGASYYKLEIAKDEEFENVIDERYIKGIYNYFSETMADSGSAVASNKKASAKFENILENNGTYYWRVKAYSKSPNTNSKLETSDTYVLRIGSKDEIRRLEEADLSPLDYSIQDYDEYIKNYVVEDDGTDHGFGLYKPGTVELLNNRIAEEKAILPTLKYNSDVIERIEIFENDMQNLLMNNAIEYTRKLSNFGTDEFTIANSTNSISFSDDGKEVNFGGLYTDVIATTRPLTPKEGISMKYKPTGEDGSWHTIGIRQTSNTVSNVLGCHTYFICFSGPNIEVQKVQSGLSLSDRIICTVENKDYVKYNEYNDFEAATINEPDGVRITLKINGQEVINYLDADNPVREIGYASIMWNKSDAKLTVRGE